MGNWLKILLYAAPVALIVYERCSKLGLAPVLPVLGLIAGIVAELKRGE